MKKIFTILILTVVITLTSCNLNFTETKNLEGVGIPHHVQYIAFNNGGTNIVEAEDADITICVQSNKTIVSFSKNVNRIQFYVYKVKGHIRMLKQNGTIVESDNSEIEIIDSEALEIHYIR
jgi:hypothetical protein